MASPAPLTGAANVVTALRALVVAWLITRIPGPPDSGAAWIAVVAASVAAALDGVDGWLARRTGTMSAFGARFDMETDAALILVLSVLAWRWEKAGPWVLLSGLMRYLFVAAVALLPWMRRSLTPTWRGKTVAVCQMVGLIVTIGPVIPVPLSAVVAAAALALLAWSFAVDVVRLWRARHQPVGQPA
jgi:phosphatidylglycerophosphate synthase